MNAKCPVCQKPCAANELHAYGKCEECYNPTPEGIKAFADPGNAALLRQVTHVASDCGGGRRVIRTTRGLS